MLNHFELNSTFNSINLLWICNLWMLADHLALHDGLIYMTIKILENNTSHLKSGSHIPNKLFYLFQWSPFKNDEKCSLFHLTSSLRSQHIYVFALTFWSFRKSGLIRQIRLISNFMTSQPGYQTITMHILPNISRSKCNQTMKFDQLIQYNKMFLFKNHAENQSGKLVLDLFNFF